MDSRKQCRAEEKGHKTWIADFIAAQGRHTRYRDHLSDHMGKEPIRHRPCSMDHRRLVRIVVRCAEMTMPEGPLWTLLDTCSSEGESVKDVRHVPRKFEI